MVQFMRPAPDLAHQIETCLFISGGEGSGKVLYEFLPDPSMSLVFRSSSAMSRVVLLGPATRTYCAEVDGSSDYLCLRFRPGQAPRIADAHPAELVDSYMEIDKIRGETVASLADRLHFLPDAASRKRLMEDLVRGALPLVRDERCRQAAALLESHGGDLHVTELADELGLHVRSVERLFLNQLGLPPKRLNRLIRFRHLIASFRSGGFENLADLAHACGYADQSHMIREFGELTGRLPGEKGAHKVRRVTGEASGRVLNRG